MCEKHHYEQFDMTNTDAYHEAKEEFNNDIITAVEEHFEADWNDIDEGKREEAAKRVEGTIRVIAYFDPSILTV